MDHSDAENFYDDNQNIDNATPDKQLYYYKKRYEDLQAEFDEYQYSSRELENELEKQLSIYERRICDFEAKNLHLLNENEVLRNKIEKITIETNQQNNILQEKLQEVTSINEQLTTHIRELEQSNDDLERAKRHLDATLADFDVKLNEQIERNELLESEIGEKEELQVVIQRLKDEARDLRLELMIQQNVKSKKQNLPTTPTESTTETGNANNSPITSPLKRPIVINNINKNATNNNDDNNFVIHNNSNSNTLKSSNQIPLLSASSRISALNIVSDLLRKVGALESKLASCRNIMPVTGNAKSPTTNGSTISNEHNSVNSTKTLKNINANA